MASLVLSMACSSAPRRGELVDVLLRDEEPAQRARAARVLASGLECTDDITIRALLGALSADADAAVRRDAAAAVAGCRGRQDVFRGLVYASTLDASSVVRATALEALARDRSSLVGALSLLLADEDGQAAAARLRADAVARLLQYLEDADATADLERLCPSAREHARSLLTLTDPDRDTRRGAVRILMTCPLPDGGRSVVSLMLHDPDESVRLESIEAACKMPSAAGEPAEALLSIAASGASAAERLAALRCLRGGIGSPADWRGALGRALGDPRWTHRLAAVRGLGASPLEPREKAEWFGRALNDRTDIVRRSAVVGLASLPVETQELAAVLADALESDDAFLRWQAARRLGTLGARARVAAQRLQSLRADSTIPCGGEEALCTDSELTVRSVGDVASQAIGLIAAEK